MVIDKFKLQLSHRGPDAENAWYSNHLVLIHRRLSIIDLSDKGNQPMISVDGKYIISFNGEIYNFSEIRQILMYKGYSFQTTTDTEVILNAYRHWGTAAFAMFNGMFALALVDQQCNELILARDHAGIKPLYYHLSDDKLIFSSEMRTFSAFDPNWPVNPNWSVYFLSFGFIPFPYTTLREVWALPKGTYLKIDLNSFIHNTQKPNKGKAVSHPIPFHTFAFSKDICNEKEALEKIRSTFIAAVDRHMISDAPLGIFLSGGIDSSLLALVADYRKYQDLNTVSLTFEEATFNEKPFQDKIIAKMRHHSHKEYKVSCSMFMDTLPDIFNAMDQPSWDGINSYFVSKFARQAGLKVVLSGLGSDEIFGGYPSFQRISLLNRLKFIPKSIKNLSASFDSEIKRLSFLGLTTNYNEFLFLRGGFTAQSIACITSRPLEEIMHSLQLLTIKDMHAERDKNLASFLETNIYMENQLLKDTDFMSMWHSLEVRVPFLDRELMELTFSIAPKIKYNQLQPKYLITKAFGDLLPPEIVFRKKQGFTFPFDFWLKNNMDFFKPMLPDTPITKPLVQKFMSGELHWSKIWVLIVWKRIKLIIGS